ncbi:hypothetical protein KPP03845_100566 [Streptomyces xanthophaeus]|uniref:hypothetical protein n=1 Tax=Streptomyces xanthophaeus TaxID=67385 RepID=UPI00233F3AD9|nr:hypothetical protein [Streptomyces xanthophaeus]WCD84245.1 hypothetical protein KPP03845_100566 [Streptomyces xanthophaeus]
MPPEKTTLTFSGKRYEVTREQVEAAATRLPPVHSTAGLAGVWYALVGTGLHHVVDLVGGVTKDQPPVRAARLALDALGLPVLCWAGPDLLDKGHPRHTG